MKCYYLPEQVYYFEKDTLSEGEIYRATFGLSDSTILWFGRIAPVLPVIEVNGYLLENVKTNGTATFSFTVKKKNQSIKYEEHEVKCYITFPHNEIGDIRYTRVAKYWIK